MAPRSVPILVQGCILRGQSGTCTLGWWGEIVLHGWRVDTMGPYCTKTHPGLEISRELLPFRCPCQGLTSGRLCGILSACSGT
jgi:hypothetical protein